MSFRSKFQCELDKPFLEAASLEIPSHADLDEITEVLESHAELAVVSGKEVKLLSYSLFKDIQKSVVNKTLLKHPSNQNIYSLLESFFTLNFFASLPRDKQARVPVLFIVTALEKRVETLQGLLFLRSFDPFHTGYLDFESTIRLAYNFYSEKEVAKYIEFREDFEFYFTRVIAKKLFFDLDPLGTGKLQIIELCEYIDERRRRGGPFEPAFTHKICVFFADNSDDGFLPKQAVRKYRLVSDMVIDHLFESKEFLDFDEFIDYVFCLEFKSSKTAMKFWLNLLDKEMTGEILRTDQKRLLRDLLDNCASNNAFPYVNVDDLMDEISDLLKSTDPETIKFSDLRKSKSFGLIVGLFTDARELWLYENREYQNIEIPLWLGN
jgi:hypothetical protein